MENKDKDYQCCNRHELLDTRRQLRKAGEPAEAVLWKCIKSRQILGFKFRRQFSVGPFILDFYCPEAKLGVELDGAGHCTIDGVKYDQQRSAYLFNERNIKILRFENRDLYYNLEGVLNEITCCLRTMKQNMESGLTPPSCGHLPLKAGEEYDLMNLYLYCPPMLGEQVKQNME